MPGYCWQATIAGRMFLPPVAISMPLDGLEAPAPANLLNGDGAHAQTTQTNLRSGWSFSLSTRLQTGR